MHCKGLSPFKDVFKFEFVLVACIRLSCRAQSAAFSSPWENLETDLLDFCVILTGVKQILTVLTVL